MRSSTNKHKQVKITIDIEGEDTIVLYEYLDDIRAIDMVATALLPESKALGLIDFKNIDWTKLKKIVADYGWFIGEVIAILKNKNGQLKKPGLGKLIAIGRKAVTLLFKRIKKK